MPPTAAGSAFEFSRIFEQIDSAPPGLTAVTA